MGEGRETGKWLQNHTPEEDRDQTAREIKEHRAALFNMSAYNRDRNLESISRNENWDGREYFTELLQEKQNLNILDSGAGWLELSRQLKETFGEKVHVTALNPTFPIPPKQEPEQSEFLQKIRQEVTDNAGPIEYYKNSNDPSGDRNREIQKKYDRHLKQIERMEESYHVIDDYRVSMAEDYTTTEKHDVIMDLWGPLHYSKSPERIMEVYFDALKDDDGRVILGISNVEFPMIQKLINKDFELNTPRANKSGCYFTLQRMADRIFEIRKARV